MINIVVEHITVSDIFEGERGRKTKKIHVFRIQRAKGSLITTGKVLSERFDLECLKIEHTNREPPSTVMGKCEKIQLKL
jgi:hypothetical protein